MSGTPDWPRPLGHCRATRASQPLAICSHQPAPSAIARKGSGRCRGRRQSSSHGCSLGCRSRCPAARHVGRGRQPELGTKSVAEVAEKRGGIAFRFARKQGETNEGKGKKKKKRKTPRPNQKPPGETLLFQRNDRLPRKICVCVWCMCVSRAAAAAAALPHHRSLLTRVCRLCPFFLAASTLLLFLHSPPFSLQHLRNRPSGTICLARSTLPEQNLGLAAALLVLGRPFATYSFFYCGSTED